MASAVHEQDEGNQTLERLAREAELPEQAARILRAAMHLFARKGYAATSVREIVQEAEVTNPMLYYYFDNKEGVFTRLIGLLFQEMSQRVEARLSGCGTLEEKMREIVAVHLEAASEAPQVLQFVYSVIFGPPESRPTFDILAQPDPTHEAVERLFQGAVDSGELVLHEGLDVPFAAQLLIGMINNHMMFSLQMMHREQDDEARGRMMEEHLGARARDQIVDFFLRGVGHVHKETGR